VVEPAAGAWRLDVMIEPGDAETWIFRRDEQVRAPRKLMIADDGIPHLRSHGALLYKAKAHRPKDEADFAVAAPLLTTAQRHWLAEALALAHPGHPWIAALS
jgi:hypothetical protein